ncbi:ABC transporter substrate-binding protein [Campylobacter sp. MIT 97-5078]|uniref:ABC transporter substrate-binding protein n=1 Tax=Campylobacter sp. MIT 97-5078 TaxID=1548153 RepID=UPI00068B885D|nr:transporter substrate-binding domain-containing protein [Campylobacter sp. MIT 97-5078]TQR26719.1 L-cystine-binding protein tcyA [Campylobacter sp. MIT 97-5078]
MKKTFFIFLSLVFYTHFAHALVIKVGTGNSYKPFCYVGENNEAVGFDIELLKLLSSIDENLSFEFVPQSFNTLFVGLDGAKFDMLAHQIAKTKEREEKYIFSDTPYFNVFLNFITAPDSNITSFADLKDKKIGAVVGSNQALRIEEFIKNEPNLNAKIVHFKNYGALFLALKNKQIDALLDNPIVALDYAKAQGVAIKITDLNLQKTSVFFVFAKENIELKNKISKALELARQKGELKALSLRYFNADYTSN